jgi:RNA polymerase sigma factor (sigma-70 family)
MTALPDWDVASDAELALSAAAGDRRAFAGIYDRYADRLHDFCIGMVRDRDSAADCVQDVFCIAAARLSQLSDPDKLRPWLYAIARSEALRCLRNRRRVQVSDELPDEVAGDPSPETLAERSELADLIAAAAGGLSERDRAVLELAYRHGLDGPELADALGVTAANANRMVSRLRQTIELALGALLVARRTQNDPDGCPELRAILAGWDGRFTILMRKRIARHIESCPICEPNRRQMVNRAALLGAVPVFIPAPAWLRGHTLGQIQLTAAEAPLAGATSDGTTTSANGSGGLAGAAVAAQGADLAAGDGVSGAATQEAAPDDRRHRGWRLLLLLLLLALIMGGVLTIPWLHQRTGPIAPADLTATPAPTTGRPITSAASRNNPPPPAPALDTPLSTITTTTPVLSPRTAVTTTPAAPPPPPPQRPAFSATTHAVTTTPQTAFVPPPTFSSPISTHDHPPTGGSRAVR